MALQTATISSRILNPKLAAGYKIEVAIEATSVGGILKETATGDVIGGVHRATTQSDGTLEVVGLPKLPQTGVEPADARWRATFKLVDPPWDKKISPPATVEFELTANTTWGALVDVSGVPITESLVNLVNAARDETLAARDQAQAAAESVQREQAGGVAGLTADGKLFESRLPNRLSPGDLSATFARAASLYGARKYAPCGDSLTSGAGAPTTALRYSTQVQRIAGSARVVEFVNGGVAGERSDQLLARMDAILAQAPDHAHIQIGTNDAGQLVPLGTYQANVQAIVAKCRAAGVTVSAGTIPPRASTIANAAAIMALTQQYNLWLTFWAPRNGIPLADVYTALADPATGYLAAAYDSGDGTHPSAAGHLAMAKAVAPYVMSAHLRTPQLVTAVSPIGLVSNPLMNGVTGWTDQGGSAASATIGMQASSLGDQLGAGAWLTYRINNSAGGSAVFRQVATALDSSKYSAGDVLLLAAKVNHSDLTDASSVKLQVTNGGTAFGVPLDTGGSIHNPGPLLYTFTVPPSPGTLRIGMVLSAAAGVDVTAFLGAVNVYNLTTGGLNGIA